MWTTVLAKIREALRIGEALWFLGDSSLVVLILAIVACGTLIVEAKGQNQPTKDPSLKPRVVIVGVNGMEWDIIRPLLIRGELPNLASVIRRGIYGKLRTLSAPNCPKIYSVIATGVSPERNGITGFTVGGITASTKMLKSDPLWSLLSMHGITVGMANVPATFPVMPVNGYMISGMLTRGKGCADGILCSPKLSEVEGGDAAYPKSLTAEIETNVGDINLDCARMPYAQDLNGNERQTIYKWLDEVQRIRTEQTKLFDYLLKNHPTDFTMFAQSCEDRSGHWLYPIQPHNVGFDSNINGVALDAFPNQYREFDKVLGTILKYVDDHTYLFIISDHGIKPLREFEEDPHTHMDHGGATPVIAKHDFADGDDVPGAFIAMGPNIKKGLRLMGFQASVLDIAPTILYLYGITPPKNIEGHVLGEIFDDTSFPNKFTKF